MPAKVTKLTFKTKGFRAILRAPRTMADLERRGRAIAAAAGDGVDVQASVGANRARVSVMTATQEAKKREAEDKSLTTAIGAGR